MRWLVTALLAATGVMLLAKVVDGSIAYYVNPRFSPLAIAAGALLLGLAGVRAAAGGPPGPAPRAPSLALLALPLVFGLLVPARPLGSAALDGGRAESAAGLVGRADPGLAGETAQWTLLDWAVARLYDADLRRYAERPVDLIGFVHRTLSMPADEFEVARFIVVCCSADGTASTLRVRSADAASLAADNWVRVEGSLAHDGAQPIVQAASVTPLREPASPYLYP